MLEGELRQPDDLLDGPGAPGAGFHRRVVRHHTDGPSVDPALAGHDAVGGQVCGVRVGEQAVLHEGALVEEERQAVADEEFVLGAEFLAACSEVALERPRRCLGNAAAIAHRLERIRTRRSMGVGPSWKRSRRNRSR